MEKPRSADSVPGWAALPLLTAEVVEAQGKNDRELLTQQVRLLLEAKEKHPSASFFDLAHLARMSGGCGSCCCPCGCGSCCCCNSFLPVRLGDPAVGV